MENQVSQSLAFAVIHQAAVDLRQSGYNCPECCAFLTGKTDISRFWFSVSGLSPFPVSTINKMQHLLTLGGLTK